MIEAIARPETLTGKKLDWAYVDEPRRGDRICHISDVRSLRFAYLSWEPYGSLDDNLDELAAADVR